MKSSSLSYLGAHSSFAINDFNWGEDRNSRKTFLGIAYQLLHTGNAFVKMCLIECDV